MESNFREIVLKSVKRIPFGKVASYGQIATISGIPRAARQVGWILHAYGDKLKIPWWRVINNKGYISIKGDPILANEQKRKLEEEGIPVNENFEIDIRKYRWTEKL